MTRASRRYRRLMTGAFCAALACPGAAFARHPVYRTLDSVTLGGEGGWDYLNLDPNSGNLFITRQTHVMVSDPTQRKLVGDILGLRGLHGTAFVGDHAFIAEGGANALAVVDTKSFAKLSEIPVGTRPDGMLYGPASKHVFTFNGRSNDATAIDPKVFSSNGGSGTVTVALEDDPNSFMVMQNVLTESGARTAEFDAKRHRIYLVTADLKPGTPTADRPNPPPVPVPGTFRLLILGP